MLSTGIDIVETNRINRILARDREQFYKRIFTQNEIQYIKGKNNNPSTVAGIFASKEAVSKSIGSGIGEISWKDIEIIHNDQGKPLVNINDNLKANLMRKGFNSIEISISHEKNYAVAIAISFKQVD